jgi:hypothetical protein
MLERHNQWLVNKGKIMNNGISPVLTLFSPLHSESFAK